MKKDLRCRGSNFEEKEAGEYFRWMLARLVAGTQKRARE
jgi:hypothetical protein